MKRLSGADAFFLYSERPTWPMHIGCLAIVDPSEAPAFGYDRLRSLLAERIAAVPEFTMKVKEVPLGLGHPILVDDPAFEIDRHVHRVAVPSPGGRRELSEVVGDLVSVRLDRRRPLWELWVIEGLQGGRVALLTKVHHAMADGVSGAGLAAVLCDLEPNPPLRKTTERQVGTERVPSDLELVASGALSAALSPPRLVMWAAEFSLRTARRAVLAQRRGIPGPFTRAPRVPWNGRLSPLRGFAFVSVPLDDVKAIRHALGGTINDVVLAVCAGALRRWLLDHGCLPAAPLVAAIPVSMRSAADQELGNQISTIFTSLETHLADPVQRLRSIGVGAAAAKEINDELLRDKDVRRLSGLVVPGLASLGWKAYVAAGLEERVPVPSDLVISNVRGPSEPLYVTGAQIIGLHPVPPAVASQGMDITVISYLDSVGFGFTVDRERIPDPWELADHVPEALDELAAAAGLSDGHPVRRARRAHPPDNGVTPPSRRHAASAAGRSA